MEEYTYPASSNLQEDSWVCFDFDESNLLLDGEIAFNVEEAITCLLKANFLSEVGRGDYTFHSGAEKEYLLLNYAKFV